MVVLIWSLMVGLCAAQSLELSLDAGSKSLSAGAHYRYDLYNGYLKAGLVGIYTDDGGTEYKWGALRVVAGNDTILEGLTCEVGVKGLLGDAENASHSGDVGAMGFTIHAGYTFPKKLIPIPIEVFSDLTYAPDLLSFQDTEKYLEGSIGVGVHIIKNASLTLTYTAYDVDMENGPGDWSLDEEVLRAGIVMRF